MARATTVLIDPLFGDGGAAMVALAHRFGRYRSYAEHEQIQLDVGEGLAQRHDSVRNFLRTGGRLGRTGESAASLTARTGYLREEYAYASAEYAEGIGAFLHHEGLAAGARQVHGAPVVEPVIAYANVMLPGQELAVHTDVPEFRGVNRKQAPQWLCVVMHHSGLFDRWRLRIATGIGWFSGGAGGELTLWPDGPDGPVTVHRTQPDTAMVLDTDSVFHGVDTVGGPDTPAPPVTAGSTLAFDEADGRWVLQDAEGREEARYRFDDLRLSVSWKAYCFADEAERSRWRDHADDLTVEAVLETLTADLAARGVIEPGAPRDRALGRAMIDTYVRYPDTAVAS